MEIKIPKGTIVKISGSACQLRRSLYVELVDEYSDKYIGRLIEVDDEPTNKEP